MTALARWLSRNKSDSLPHTLIRERIYIVPTKQGFFFILVLVLMLMIAVNYNNNLAFLLTFLLFSILITSTVHTHKNLSGIRLIALDAKPVFEGNDAEFSCAIDPASNRRIALTLSVDNGDERSVTMPATRTDRLNISVPANKRGLLKPKVITISSNYPFAFFVAWSYVHPNVSCVVYPKPVKGTVIAEVGKGKSSKKRKALKIPGSEDFQGIRSYQPGDSLRKIYWKGYTKTGQLMTKFYEAEKGQSVLYDYSSLKGYDSEERLSILCNAIVRAAQANLTYSLKLPNKFIEAGRGEKHRRRCLEALALFGVSEEA